MDAGRRTDARRHGARLDRALLSLADRLAAGKQRRREPHDDWVIELDGEDVGLLTASFITDMFWKMFLVVGDDPRFFDEPLWLHCRFAFRHANSGRRAPHAFCGGQRPTANEPWVSMRGLY